MAAHTADFMPNGLTIREDTPTDTSSMAHASSPEDPLSADWSQWMRWDELDLDDIPGHVDNPDTLLLRPDARHEHTSAPVDLKGGMTKAEFSFQGSMSQSNHLRGLSNSSMDFNPAVCTPSYTSPFPAEPMPSTVSMMNLHNQYPQQRQLPQRQSYPGPQHMNNTNNVLMSPLSTTPPSRKRKTSTDEEIPGGSVSPDTTTTPASKTLPSKKRSHNVIEKRYRANLNEKIADLRDAVPSLRAIYRQRNGGGGPDNEEDEGIASGNKLNKASILSKATEYIKHLEVRNKRLDEENMALKNRLRELEKSQEQGMMSFGSATNCATSPSGYTVSSDSATGTSPGVFSHTEEFSPEGSPNPLYPPEGLIKVPEFFKRMRAATGPQPHYADSLLSRQNSKECSNDSTVHPRGVANKFMIGTLAGLMVVGGLESRKETDGSEKGLLAIPFQLLGEAFKFSQRYFYLFRTASWYIRAGLQLMATSAFVIGCAFVVFLYLFYSRPRQPRDLKQRTAQATSTAITPAEFRREAWLTSIQTVGVPRHTFFPEWYAVTSRCLEYCLRCLLGWSLYSWITGISEDDENGRVKAWDIALDAQLTGGDAEVSKSRLVLTIFAAGTLPRSPARCMLKSMHCRILLWRVGIQQSMSGEIADNIAFALARYQWKLAQEMQKATPEDHEDHLPSHLAFLLQKDCDDVLTDNIIQRSWNMIWNRPTQEATDGEDALLDVVVEDTSIRSPLDALAAWWSSTALQDALIHSFDSNAIDCDERRRKGFEQRLDLAVKSAPITSCAYARAAVIRAVFFDEGRVDNINAVLAALPKPKRCETDNTTIFVDTSVPPSARAEISTAVRCAMIAAILKGQVGSGSPQLSLRNAIELFNKLPIDPVELTLLGFAALYHLLHIVASDDRLMPSASLSSSVCSSFTGDSSHSDDESDDKPGDRLPPPNLARAAKGLIYWVRNAYNPISSGFTPSIQESVVDSCVAVCRDAGVLIDVDAIELEMNHTAEVEVDLFVSESKSNEQGNPNPAQTESEDSETSGSRRDSIKSTDTGYTSPTPIPAGEVKEQATTPSN